MTAKDNKQKMTDSCPRQEADVQESCSPCADAACDVAEDEGCAPCE